MGSILPRVLPARFNLYRPSCSDLGRCWPDVGQLEFGATSQDSLRHRCQSLHWNIAIIGKRGIHIHIFTCAFRVAPSDGCVFVRAHRWTDSELAVYCRAPIATTMAAAATSAYKCLHVLGLSRRPIDDFLASGI